MAHEGPVGQPHFNFSLSASLACVMHTTRNEEGQTKVCGELSHLLDKAEAEAQGIAATYRNTLDRDDHDMLVLAFHRA